MERRFVVEAKTFSFMARKGNEIIRLEEKRKGFGGFILLGIKGRLVGQRGGGGDGGSNEGGFRQKASRWSEKKKKRNPIAILP
jgi:hypothetical protein